MEWRHRITHDKTAVVVLYRCCYCIIRSTAVREAPETRSRFLKPGKSALVLEYGRYMCWFHGSKVSVLREVSRGFSLYGRVGPAFFSRFSACWCDTVLGGGVRRGEGVAGVVRCLTRDEQNTADRSARTVVLHVCCLLCLRGIVTYSVCTIQYQVHSVGLIVL